MTTDLSGTHGDEHSWIITGTHKGRLWLGRRHHEQVGSPTRVGFDAKWAEERELEKRDVIGWYHTHPPRCDAYVSDRDFRTMRVWAGCLGKPLLCLIEGNQGLRGWVFQNEDCEGIPVSFAQLLGNIVVGVERGRGAASRRGNWRDGFRTIIVFCVTTVIRLGLYGQCPHQVREDNAKYDPA